MKFLNYLMTSYFLCLLIAVPSVFAETKLEPLWLTEGLKTPESVLVYRDTKYPYLLVSQIDGDPSAVDGQGAIAKMSTSGELADPNWVTGLNAPKGMATFEGKLYVADINEVVVIDVKKAVIEKKIPVSGALFLNDVTVDTLGTLYVSDTKTSKVYRIRKGVVEEYLTKLDNANGVKSMASNLVVGAGTHLYLFDRNQTKLEIASGFIKNIDGVEPINRGDFLVTCWEGVIYYVHIDGKIELLLDSQAAKINTADIAYDSDSQTLFVPNFFKNTVTAYKVVTK